MLADQLSDKSSFLRVLYERIQQYLDQALIDLNMENLNFKSLNEENFLVKIKGQRSNTLKVINEKNASKGLFEEECKRMNSQDLEKEEVQIHTNEFLKDLAQHFLIVKKIYRLRGCLIKIFQKIIEKCEVERQILMGGNDLNDKSLLTYYNKLVDVDKRIQNLIDIEYCPLALEFFTSTAFKVSNKKV